MTEDKVIERIIELEEENDRLLPLSTKKDGECFNKENIISSVFYSNLLEGNTLSREKAIEAMFGKDRNDTSK